MYGWMKVAVVIQAILIVVVVTVVGWSLFSSGSLLTLMVPVAAVVLGVGTAWYAWARVSTFESQNYDWYRRRYPSLVSANRVLCFNCKGSQVRVRGLMNHTYTREHESPRDSRRLFGLSQAITVAA